MVSSFKIMISLSLPRRFDATLILTDCLTGKGLEYVFYIYRPHTAPLGAPRRESGLAFERKSAITLIGLPIVASRLRWGPTAGNGASFPFYVSLPHLLPKNPIQSAPIYETIRNGFRKKGTPSSRKGAHGPVISGKRGPEFDGGAHN